MEFHQFDILRSIFSPSILFQSQEENNVKVNILLVPMSKLKQKNLNPN